MDSSLYLEVIWILSLFGATALLREALGELCVRYLAFNLFSNEHIRGKCIDSILSASNGARSFGFGAAWKVDLYDGIKNKLRLRLVVCVPLTCWLVGIPIKIIAVSALKPNSTAQILDQQSALTVGVCWILFCVVVKGIAFLFQRQIVGSAEAFERMKILQSLATMEGYGRLLNPELYNGYNLNHGVEPLGLDVSCDDNDTVSIKLVREATAYKVQEGRIYQRI